ncbi:MAG: bifunctional glutamate N-acetyltransferase/amino-acid acetyltransferase ArgJ [Dactylosporangium sp.]|nr:bifunctional glutamate N-acetyltransferase/amino-acid acetyltransferase ArgJ [Dactylosporangium sp.]NNJ61775.1 bifunctional glutamate N-acetyltransferase/amino-acid acetyltransferase ArgJ [Dactylosporangium sp.]
MSVTAPRGFRAAGASAGLKAGGALDVALVVNDGPDATAAGVFTTNRIKAAPVQWSSKVLRQGVVRAVVLNSGGANACTGARGLVDTRTTADHVAARLTAAGRYPLGPADVAVCSTGLIGVPLPVKPLLTGIDEAVRKLAKDGGPSAAEAIMTTDTRPKTAVVTGEGFTVGGMAKGAGMLAPGLATMLVVLTTDAVAGGTVLDAALRSACAATFDRVDSDGCMSTNDTVLLLASGASGICPDPGDLTAAVTATCADLASQLVADAEGATKEIAIEVTGAASTADAIEVARAIARSSLVKCAIFGNDPNWGRVLAAVGTTEAAFAPDAVDVTFNGVPVCVGGAIGADRSQVDLAGRNVTVAVELHAGPEQATIWTNDLSIGYVRENSEYAS